MTVYLVGAGPGDPDLLTRRGARLLACADVVIVDRLIDPRLLEEVRPDAHVIPVGKQSGDPARSTAQDEICRLLIEHGRAREVVVRLKGGDPFLFGRGGEEVAALRDAGVDVEIVPGVSSALAVPALAGIPVTHRGVSSALTVVSGHDVGAVDVDALVGTRTTVVLLMGVATRGAFAERLIAAGRDPATPVGVIERGSMPGERRRTTTLGALGDLDVESPAVIVIGDVASLGGS